MYRTIVISILGLSPVLASAQAEDWYHVGRIISTSLLQRLTNSEGTQFRVGVVNVTGDTGMLVSPQGSPPVVEFIRGNESWLWATAAEQLESGEGGAVRFEVLRKAVDADMCPELQAAHIRFYRELERALAEDISLSSLPEKPMPETIMLDGTVFPVQIYTESNYVTIMADRDVNRDFHEAAYDLNHVVSGCSNEVEGRVEEHYR